MWVSFSPLLSSVTRDAAALNQDGSHQQLAEMPLLIKVFVLKYCSDPAKGEKCHIWEPWKQYCLTSKITTAEQADHTNTWHTQNKFKFDLEGEKTPLQQELLVQLKILVKNIRTRSLYWILSVHFWRVPVLYLSMRLSVWRNNFRSSIPSCYPGVYLSLSTFRF